MTFFIRVAIWSPERIPVNSGSINSKMPCAGAVPPLLFHQNR